jgi:hypothetical protein
MRHEFEPGFTGMTCEKMILDEYGFGTTCGLSADKSIHFLHCKVCGHIDDLHQYTRNQGFCLVKDCKCGLPVGAVERTSPLNEHGKEIIS